MARPRPSNRTPRFILLASICVIVAALYFAQDVLIPLALAILFSFLLTPMVRRLERWSIPRVASVMMVVTLGLALVGVIGYTVYAQLVDLANGLPQYRQNIEQKLTRVIPVRGGIFAKLKETAEDLNKIAATATTQATQPATGGAAGTKTRPLWVIPIDPPPTPLRFLQQTLGPLLGPLGTAGIVLVFVIFMLLAREDLRDRLIRLVGHGQLRITTQALDDAAKRISRYLLMQTLVNGTYGIAIGIGLRLIGVPNAALWGLFCTILRFIPYIGPWIAASFPLVLSLASFPGFTPFIETAILFVAIELLSNNFMEPWLYGSSTGMSTMAVLVSAVFWTWLWGPIGLVMATPLTVCLVVLGKYVPQLKFLDILLGDEPVLEPAERIYQRLLAGDPEEAEELLDEFLQKQPLEEVYDQVLVPALAMAERDTHSGRLDGAHSQEIRDAMRELVDELGEREKARSLRRDADRTLADAKGQEPSPTSADSPASPPRPHLPAECAVTVTLLPAHDEADEIVARMLAQLLELRGYCAVPVSQTALASEMLQQIEKEQADIVVVSALPPAAVAHARYLCKRLAAHLPHLPAVVGLWTLKGELTRAKRRILCSDSVTLATSFEQALDQIHQFAQPMIIKREPDRQHSTTERT